MFSCPKGNKLPAPKPEYNERFARQHRHEPSRNCALVKHSSPSFGVPTLMFLVRTLSRSRSTWVWVCCRCLVVVCCCVVVLCVVLLLCCVLCVVCVVVVCCCNRVMRSLQATTGADASLSAAVGATYSVTGAVAKSCDHCRCWCDILLNTCARFAGTQRGVLNLHMETF